MQFMIAFAETADDFAQRRDPARAGAYWAAWTAYIGALQQSGVVVSGAGLEPPETATTVRLRGGRRVVQDGPFADSHEHLAGFFIIEVSGLDEALAWAERAPCSATGGTEVRPLMVMPAPAG